MYDNFLPVLLNKLTFNTNCAESFDINVSGWIFQEKTCGDAPD